LADCTLVHNQETTVPLNLPLCYRDYLRDSCKAELSVALSTYAFIESGSNSEYVSRYLSCRTRAWFVRDSETGSVYVASNCCRLRWCPLCAYAKSRAVSSNVSDWCKTRNDLRFLTLTLKHSSSPLRSQIDYLYSCFRRLRKHKQFKPFCRGGIWFFQCKYIEDSGQWHPHLHILIAGKFIPQEWLSKLWCHITKGSSVVDIRAVKNSGAVADYVARYVSTPAKLSSLTLPLRVELFETFHGRRLCGTFGVAKKVRLSRKPSSDFPASSVVGSFSFVYSTKNCDSSASQIWHCWKTGSPLSPDIDLSHLDDSVRPHAKNLEIDVDHLVPEQYTLW